MQGQALLVEPGIQQPGQDVGPVRGHGGATDPGREHPPDAGDGPLDPHPSGHGGDQVGAAGQRRRQPVEVGDLPNPAGHLGQARRA